MLELFGISFIVLLLLGVPLGFTMILSSLLYITTSDLPTAVAPQQVFQGLNHFAWLAIPLFLLAGELMNTGGITLRIVDFVRSVLGHFRGGLAYVTVVTNVFMAGISGSALADAAGTGSVLIPSMQKAGYGTRLPTAIVAASSTIGPIIPPSIPFILYATLAGVSVSQMFASGFLPGLGMALTFFLLIAYLGKRHNFPRDQRSPLRSQVRSFFKAFWALLMPVIILGGILSGAFTATEAAAVAAAYAFIISMFVYRELKFRDLGKILLDSAMSSAIIMFAIGAAGLLAWLLTHSAIAGSLADLITGATNSPVVFLAIVAVLLLILGCFMEATPLIIILTPVLLPIAITLGVDPIHFGLMMVLVLMIGLITPPVGMVLFITAGIGKTNVVEVTKGVWPFMIAIFAVVAAVILFPAAVLWLPGIM